jgi:hypothetical protein
LLQERSQLFWSVTVPRTSLVPGRGFTHIWSKLDAGRNVPEPPLELLLELLLLPLPSEPPPPPQAVREANRGKSNSPNTGWLFT